MTIYVRCPDCQGGGNDGYCNLCSGIGNLSEEDLIAKLGEDEAGELLDYYHRRGKFTDIPPSRISPIVKGYDA